MVRQHQRGVPQRLCLAREVAPRDIIAWMLIKDLADHRLEIARYRRLKSLLIERAAEQERLRLGDQAPAIDEPYKRNFDEVRASFRVAGREIYGNDPRFEEARQEELRNDHPGTGLSRHRH